LTMDVLHVGGYPSGTADPGTDLLVVRDWDDGNGAWVTSGPDGAWAAPTLSADAGIEMQARIEDADGDRQTIDRRVPAPRIVVEPRSQVVSAEDFEPPAGQPNGEPYDGTLTVATPGEADCSLTVEFSDGWMNVALWPVDAENASCGIAVGDTVTVQAGGTTKSLVVDPLMVTTVDADTVSGSASPGSNVELRADFWDVQAGMASATADENGAWSATEWGWDQEPADLSAADELRAWIVDDDGDLTQGRFVRETLAVDPDLDQVWGWGWPDGATLTVDGRPAMQMQTLCHANEAYWYSFLQPVQGPYEMRACDGPMTGYPAVFLDLTEQGVDLVPGDQVTVADASGRSRGLTVRDIKVLDVNEAESTVTGRSDVPVTPSLLTGLAMGFWELPAGDWHFVLTDHPYYPGPMPEGEAGVFRSIHPDDQGETVVRWTAESAPSYVFEGFTAPVDMGGVVNVANPGKTIPLRFRLTRDGAPVLDLTQAAITAVSTTCPAGAVSDKLESYSSAKAPVLQNLGDGYYRYNWKTAKTFAKSCYLVSIDLGSFGAYPTEPTIFRFK
ncbi:MAG: PxKF domain-containing protein, partial [Actinomycetota bacterium]